MAGVPDWQLQPVSSRARVWLFVLTVAVPMATLLAALAYSAGDPGPKTLIAGSEALTAAIVAGGTLALCLVVYGLVARALRRHRVAVDADGLSLATTLYARTLRWSELDLSRARVVDLEEHPGLKPMLKTNGTSLPGFRSGWFRLRDRRKALVAIGGGPRVLHLPTTLGYDLLLEPRQPRALLNRLHELAPGRSRG